MKRAMARSLLLLILLAAPLTLATPRLFPQPSLLSLAGPDLKAGVDSAPRPRLLLATGAAAALFVTPAALMLGGWAGTWSNNLLGALLPALLIALLLPPLAVVFSEWTLANRGAPGTFRWVPALAVALVTQLALIGGAVLLGVSGVSAAGIALFTLADVVALPTVTTAMLRWTQRPDSVTSELQRASGDRLTVSVPVLSGSF